MRLFLKFFYVFVFLLVLHVFVEARSIPGPGMQPTLQIGDRIALEKVSAWTGQMLVHGAIVCFYAPPIEMRDGEDLTFDLPNVLGRMSGLPFFPNYPAYIKRIIGLEGDRIQIKQDVGVFVNDTLLTEPYVTEPAAYSLKSMADIGGRNSTGAVIQPYPGDNQTIVVPKGKLFVLGDNRNNSEDSHIFGFISKDRIIGRTWFIFSPISAFIRDPNWIRPKS